MADKRAEEQQRRKADLVFYNPQNIHFSEKKIKGNFANGSSQNFMCPLAHSL